MLIVGPFLAFQYVTVDVRNHRVGVYNTVMDVGYEHMSIYRELGLRVTS